MCHITHWVNLTLVFGSFLGKKDISKLMLDHPATSVILSSKMLYIAKNMGFIFIRLFGYPLNYIDRMRIRTILSYFLEHEGEVLDVGCSFGVLGFELANRGFNVTAIDVNPESIKLGKNIKRISQVHNINFIEKDFLESNFISNHFDIVTMIEVLEHIKDDSKVIKEIYRILKIGGRVIISVPYKAKMIEHHDSPIPALIKNGKHVRIGVPGEFHYRDGYNTRKLISLMQYHGFSIEDIKFTPESLVLSKSILLFPFTFIIAILFKRIMKNYSKLTVLATKSSRAR